jgi:hypothetical protein
MNSVLSGLDILSADAVEKASIVYRPLYYLPGAYQSTARRWRDEYPDKRLSPSQRIISFDGLQKKSWAQLGMIETEGDEDADELLFRDVEITLRYTGIGAFDVKRGLW